MRSSHSDSKTHMHLGAIVHTAVSLFTESAERTAAADAEPSLHPSHAVVIPVG